VTDKDEPIGEAPTPDDPSYVPGGP